MKANSAKNSNSLNAVTLIRSRKTWIAKFPAKTIISPDLRVIAKALNEYNRSL